MTKSSNLQAKLTNTPNPVGCTARRNDDSPEINKLNSKLDRFYDNVTSTLHDLNAEINSIKENRPYSILVLENVVNDLKEEKLELSRKNDKLREQNMDMSHTISNLTMANKNLESEKSSLLTALKLMQNDYQQKSVKTTVENNGENNAELVSQTIEESGVTQPDPSANQPDIDKHNTATNLRKNRKKKGKKSKPSQNSSQRTADISDGIMNTSSSKSTGQGKETVVIAGDSIVKNIIGPKMSADDPDHYYIVKPFPGATVSDMEDFVKPLTRRSPDKMILHVGTNDLRNNSSPKIIADSIVNIVTQIKEDSPGTAVGISAILVRNGNNELAAKATQTNNILKGYCSRNRIPFLSNSNMNHASHLNMRGLHLNRHGSLTLQQNLLGFAKMISN